MSENNFSEDLNCGEGKHDFRSFEILAFPNAWETRAEQIYDAYCAKCTYMSEEYKTYLSICNKDKENE